MQVEIAPLLRIHVFSGHRCTFHLGFIMFGVFIVCRKPSGSLLAEDIWWVIQGGLNRPTKGKERLVAVF